MAICSLVFAYENHPRTCRKQNGKTERPSDTHSYVFFLYCLILPVNKYHFGTGLEVMKLHKNIISCII